MLAYFLTLFYMAVTHASRYGAIWTRTIYKAPWFVELDDNCIVEKPCRKATNAAEPYENPAFSAMEDEDIKINDYNDTLIPPHAPYALKPGNVDLERLPISSAWFRAAPSPTQSQESLRPQWAKRVNTRRGVDKPFPPKPVGERPVFRPIKSHLSAPRLPPSPLPKPNLPEPANLNGGFLDCHRASYGLFPEGVDDANVPIQQPRLSQWLQARR